jgi:hypothetical protein
VVHVVGTVLEADFNHTDEGAEVRMAREASGEGTVVDGEVGSTPGARREVERLIVLVAILIFDLEV